MNPSPNSDETLFADALARPAGERAAFLDQACAGNPARRKRLEALLRAEAQAGEGFMGTESGPAPSVSREPAPGTVIGRYKLLQKLGEGGCGIVYMAEQEEPVRRRVALKVIKLGMDTKEVVARFEAERQALALMDHPNIARVFDGGATESGRPFFVMELVRGVPITKYCDERNLPTAARLELFTQVCHAVQHAHQKGIIHRDLKPSNILVTLHDGIPVPKVIDFGIAKATQGRLTDATLFTAFEQFIGTPAYMSPEQAELSGLDIDTRSDIYSLGVLLYELLTGRTPFDPKSLVQAGLDEIRRIIREVEPPRPSTRLSTLTDADRATIAKQRGTAPAQLSTLLRGDLDWIAMRCLEKDRTRRYETANGLARDLDRFLCDEPVEARPPSATYRFRKLLRRNRGPVLAAAMVLVTLVIGIIGTTWGLIRAEKSLQVAETSRQAEAEQRRLAEAAKATAQAKERQAGSERDRAEQEKRVALAVKDFLQNRLLAQANPFSQADALVKADGTPAEIKPNPTVRELLDRAAAELTPEKIEVQFPNLPLVQAEILRTIGGTYMKLNEGAWESGIAHLERSRDLYIRHLGADHEQTFATLNTLGLAYMRGRKYRHAAQTLQQVRDRQMAVLGPDHPTTLETLHNIAWTFRDDAKFQESIQLFEQVHERRSAVLGPEHLDTMLSLGGLALTYSQSGNAKKSIPLFERVRDRHFAKLGPDHPQTLWTLWGLAGAYEQVGKRSQGLELLEQVHGKAMAKLGLDNLLSRYVTTSLAFAYLAAGRTSEGVRLLENMHAHNTATYGPEHPTTARVMHDLAHAYGRTASRRNEEMSLLEAALKINRRQLGPDHVSTLENMRCMAVAYRNADRHADALPFYEELVERTRRANERQHPRLAVNLLALAATYQAVERRSDAIRVLEEFEQLKRATAPATNAETLEQAVTLADLYRSLGRVAEAIAAGEEALRRGKELNGIDAPKTLVVMNSLANAYRSAGRRNEAIAVYQEIIERRYATLGADHPATLSAKSALANVYGSAKEWSRAESIHREVLEAQRRKEGAATPIVATAEATLGLNLLAQQKFSDAESLLRSALATREKNIPESWLTFNSRSALGAALMGMKNFTDAEPLLLAGYEGLKAREEKIPPASKFRLKEALERLVQFYTATENQEKASRWKTALDESMAAQMSPTGSPPE